MSETRVSYAEWVNAVKNLLGKERHLFSDNLETRRAWEQRKDPLRIAMALLEKDMRRTT